MLFIKEIRENAFRIPKTIRAYLTSGIFGYHCGIHWVLALLPERLRNHLLSLYGPIIETVHAAVIMALFLFAAPNPPGSERFSFALFVTLITMLSPIVNKADGRSYSVNGRTAGNLLLNLTYTGMIVFLSHTGVFWLFLALLSTALLLLSSQFAFQAFLFFALLILILSGRYEFLLLIPVGMLIAELISGGAYHRMFWINSYQHKKMLFRFRNKYAIIGRFSSLKSVLAALASSLKSPGTAMDTVYRNPIMNGLIHAPTVFILFYGIPGPSDGPWFFWALSAVITMFLIDIPILRFLGEPHRYLEYATLPLAYLFMHRFPNFGAVHVGLFLWFAVVQALNYYALWSSPYSKRLASQEDEALSFLSALEPGNLMSIPTFFGIKAALTGNHRVVEFAGTIGSTRECNHEFTEIYPSECDYPNRDLTSVIGRYNLDYIVVDHGRLDISPYGKDYDTSSFQKLFDNEAYTIYQVHP